MGRLLALFLGVAVVFGCVYYVLTARSAVAGHEPPPQQLENVREAARDIEADTQKRVDDLAKKFQ